MPLEPAVEMTDRPQRAVARVYGDEDRVKAFSALMRNGGDARKACRELNDQGLDVQPDLLLEWRDRTHSPMYVALAEEQGRAVEEMVAARLRENALRAVQLESELMERIGGQVDKADITDAAKALDAVQKARSSGVDRTLTLTGRPVDGRGQADPVKIMQELGKLLAGAGTVDGEVVEEATEA